MTRALDCSYYFEVHILELFSTELRGGRKEGILKLRLLCGWASAVDPCFVP